MSDIHSISSTTGKDAKVSQGIFYCVKARRHGFFRDYGNKQTSQLIMSRAFGKIIF